MIKHFKNFVSLTLILCLSFGLVACKSKANQDSGTKNNEISEDKTEEKNTKDIEKKDAEAYIDHISKDSGATEEEHANKKRVEAKELTEEIKKLMQKTKDLDIKGDEVSINMMHNVVEWLHLVDKCIAPSEDKTLSATLSTAKSQFAGDDLTNFNKKFERIIQVASAYNDGNVELVSLLRNSGTNPNTVPFVFPSLLEWHKILVGQ